MRNTFDHHADRDGPKALEFIRATFATPVPLVPPVVKLVVGTDSLQLLYTTNFDEVLAAATDSEPAAAYPDYDPGTSRVIYLHGRASTAKSFHSHLVLGEQGYRLAYDTLPGKPARTQVQRLATRPVVFIGFSMSDEDVTGTLEEMAAAARRIERSDEGILSEELYTLNWYVLLKAPPRSDSGRVAWKANQERSLEASGVEVIWYSDGGEQDPHRALQAVALQMNREARSPTVSEQEPALIDALLEAEELAATPFPTPSDVRRARAALDSHPQVAAAFLRQVDGLEWFRELRDMGRLNPEPSAPGPDGTRRASHWLAASFLQRVAAVAPEEVKDFLVGIDTDNWVAIRQALSVLEALDDDSAAAIGKDVAEWVVAALPAEPWLLVGVVSSARRLASDGKHSASLALIREILEAVAGSTLDSLGRSARTFGADVAPILAHSSSGLDIASNALRAVLERDYVEPHEDSTRYTRQTIEAHRNNLPDNSTLGLAIDLVRDTLLATDDESKRNDALAALLESHWPTERRVAIAHCFLRRSDLSSHEAAIISPENLGNPHLFHELAMLIADHTSDLSDSSERVLRTFVQELHAQTDDSARYDYELWARILPGDWLPERLPEDEEDDPDRRLFRDVYFSGVVTATAPLDRESFATQASLLSPEDLLAFVRDPAGAGVRVRWHHQADLMWELLSEYVKERELLPPLLAIEADDLGGDTQSWRAIEAMADVAGDSSERWSHVLDWSSRMIVEAPVDRFWSLGLLLEKAGTTTPLDLSDRVRDLAFSVIEQTRRLTSDRSLLSETSMRGGFLNQPAGRSTQALFALFLREMAERSSASGEGNDVDLPSWFTDGVLEPLVPDPTHLGIDVWIALGRYFALLTERAPNAVAFVAPQLESESSPLSDVAVAFWSGYLWAPTVSSEALATLRTAYGEHARELQNEGVLEADLRDMFFQHVAIGALREVPGYDGLLLETLGDEFHAAARGAIANALGRGVAEAVQEPGSQFQTTATAWFRRYWARHVDQIGGEDGPQLARYLAWLQELGLPPSEIAHLVEASLDQADTGHRAWEVLEYVSHYVEDDPEGTLRLLFRCIEWWRLHGGFWLDGEKVRTLLERLAPLVPKDGALIPVIEGFAELGAISADDARRLLE